MKRTILAASVAAAIVAVAPGAQATTFVQINLQSSSGILTSAFGAQAIDAGGFNHVFKFNLSAASVATSQVSTIVLTATGAPGDIDFSSILLDSKPFVLGGTDDFETAKLTLTGLAAGDHYIYVNGSAVGGGSYSGTLNVTAVPEPATWSLMIAGLGILGAAMRHRVRATRIAFS